MANICNCELTITGKAGVKDCLEFIRSTEDSTYEFDFNRVIPMPECLINTERGSASDYGLLIIGAASDKDYERVLRYRWIVDAGITTKEILIAYLKATQPEAEAEGRKCLIAREQTGFDNWYDWVLAKWGTKWNADGTYFIYAGKKRARLVLCHV